MNSLLIENINKTAPYMVVPMADGMAFEFFTKHDIHYSVSFLYDDALIEEGAYQLVIANINNRKSPNDPSVKETVLAIVEEFFRANNAVMLYICETGDVKQVMRNRLFERWFSTFQRKTQFTCLSSSIVDEDGIINYATIIIRNDHPHLVQVLQEFSATIGLLGQKPE